MLYRVPAELDFLLPSYPIDDTPPSRPWRGDFTWTGIDNDPSSEDKKISYVHAAETEGDIRSDLWPENLSLRSSRSGFALADVHAWVQSVAPPLCMFMPGHSRDPAVTQSNQTNFRQFARLLRDRQVVAISRWHGPGKVPGSGLVIFPVEASTGLLAAAVFHSSPIPEFSVPCQSSFADVARPDFNSREYHHLQRINTQFDPADYLHRLPEYASPTSSPSPILNTPPVSAIHSPWEALYDMQPTSPSYTVPRTQFLHNSFLNNDLHELNSLMSMPPPMPSNYALCNPQSSYTYRSDTFPHSQASSYATSRQEDWLTAPVGHDASYGLGHEFTFSR